MNVINDFDYNDTWHILDEYFLDKTNLISHHLVSFNNFIEHLIPQTLDELSPQSIYYDFDTDLSKYKKELHITFMESKISKPVVSENNGNVNTMFPNEARLRNLTYSGTLYCNIKIEQYKYNKDKIELENSSVHENVVIGKIPIMVGSKYCVLNDHSNQTKSEMGECEFDYGGYFIVLGSEKIVIPQESKCPNKVYVFPPTKNLGKFSKIAEITSLAKNKLASVKPLQVRLYNKDNQYGKVIKISLKRFKSDIPLFIAFRALGVISDKDIIQYIVNDINDETNQELIELLNASLEEASGIKTQELALKYLSKYTTVRFDYKNNQELTDENKIKYVNDVFNTELLPHVGSNKIKKAYFLGHIVNKLLLTELGRINYDDRDSFLNKRVESTGQLLNTLFRTNFNKMIKDMRNLIEKDIKANRLQQMGINIEKKIKENTIDQGMKYGLATGNWNIKGTSAKNLKQGIAQVLNRLSYASTLSYMRRINAPIDRSLKDVKPRFLHNTQFGNICPSETPEGQAIGIVKNMALTSTITIAHDENPILNILEENDLIYINNLNPSEIQNATYVFMNGDLIGIHKEPNVLVKNLKQARRTGVINVYTSICWNIDLNNIMIYSDAGRLCRPLYIVENNNLMLNSNIIQKIKDKKLNWNNFVCKQTVVNSNDCESFIEYIDIEESNTIMIAMSTLR